ncbi:hypothetical protein [Spiroplasma endosymbiont of Nebria brevicollis]|uniref:hypothetical protein n=1 Tax=Spiroplasma endosymbiont of Nebria brevicollis TaxID=3066284 RepID=UPI00313C4708
MRKILTILWTVSTIIIACNNNSNNDIKYEINDKGEIIYNFQEKQAYIIGFTINGKINQINIYLNKIPFETTLYGQGTQYWTYININDNKAWTTVWYTNNLIYLKKGNL